LATLGAKNRRLLLKINVNLPHLFFQGLCSVYTRVLINFDFFNFKLLFFYVSEFFLGVGMKNKFKKIKKNIILIYF
jgi:hypothetical protein